MNGAGPGECVKISGEFNYYIRELMTDCDALRYELEDLLREKTKDSAIRAVSELKDLSYVGKRFKLLVKEL